MKNILFNKDGMVTEKNVNYLAENNVSEFVEACEKRYDDQLEKISKLLADSNEYKIVLLAGPSGSGKTTTAKKLSEKIKEKGKHAIFVSLDDFFLNRENLPKLPNGETDFESVYTLDIAEIRKCFSLLLSGQETFIPHFDFTSGKRDPKMAKRYVTGENDVIIVEGLHAINPELTNGIEAFGNKGFLRLFVNPDSQIMREDGSIALRRRTLRMMRRMIRDYYFRGSSVENTLNMWEGVYREENKSIIPLKPFADIVVDTTHFYEPCIYHHYLLPIIEKTEFTNKAHAETMQGVVQMLRDFYDVPASVIPKNSLLREFVGEE